MKSNILILLCCLAGTLSAGAQNALLDAIHLRRLADPGYPGNEQTVLKLKEQCPACDTILRRYVSPSERILFDGFARTNNPFIGKREGEVKVLLPQVFNTARMPGIALTAPEMTTPAASPSGKGAFVNNVADGLAKFLVNRTKEELSIAFFTRFQEDVGDNNYLKMLMPGTASMFRTVGRDIYRYNLFIQAFRQEFQRDLKNLPAHLGYTIRETNLIAQPKWRIALHDALQLSQLLVDRRPPDSVLLYLGRDAWLQNATSEIAVLPEQERQQINNLAATLQLTQLLSESLRSPEQGQIWMKAPAIREALRDSATLYLYLGLLWQQGHQKNIGFSKPGSRVTLQDALSLVGRSQEHRAGLQQFLAQFGNAAEEVENRLRPLRADTGAEAVAYDRYYVFFDQFFSLMAHSITFKEQFFGKWGASSEMDSVFLGSLRHLNNINFNVRQRHYSAAVADLGGFLTDIALSNDKARQKILKYGFFMASVAEADHSDQVAAALEAVALPPGSSVVKKQTAWSAALNAYTGLAGGQEHLLDVGLAPAGFAAVAAPVGITVSKGLGNAGSLSLLIPVIDVGALVAFRFKDDRADLLPKLSWSNIVAPGAYLAYGFFNNIPVSVGLGAQIGPNLRAIDPGLPTAVTAKGWRWGGFLSVDIPLFNLYSK